MVWVDLDDSYMKEMGELIISKQMKNKQKSKGLEM
jgi:hypothetical protein